MRIVLRHHRGLGEDIDQRVRQIVPDARIDHLKPDEPGFDEAWTNCEVFVGGPPLDRAHEAKKLRWVQASWSGIATLGRNAPAHWLITGGAGLFGPAIAEHVWAMLLHFRRNLHRCVTSQRERRWGIGRPPFIELAGQTLLMLGLGDIGRAVATRAAAFGMRVVGMRRDTATNPPAGVERIIGLDGLDSALPGADVVVAALPGTPHTRGLLDARRLGLLKPGAGLINVGRGSLIDRPALVDALKAGRPGWAGLDVFDPEPLPEDDPLWAMDNVLITPHVAGATDRAAQRLAELFLANLRLYASGREDEMRNLFSREWGY